MLDYSNIFDKEALDYPSYRNLVDELLAQGQTTGPDDSEAMLHYTKMNVQRMNRVDKTAVLSEEILETLKVNFYNFFNAIFKLKKNSQLKKCIIVLLLFF